jgi:glycosidase
MIYYGTELLMNGEEQKGHGFIRQDFPEGSWQSAVSGQQPAVSGQQEEALQYMKKLLNWRKTSQVIHSGKLMQFVPQDGIYVYFRYNHKDAVMVVINKNKEVKKLDLSRFREVLKDYHGGKDVISGKVFLFDYGLQVTPETALILEMD